jgi:hypothetical protein
MNADGSGSSDNITNLFLVTPVGSRDEKGKIMCRIDDVWTPEII